LLALGGTIGSVRIVDEQLGECFDCEGRGIDLVMGAKVSATN